MKFRMRGLWRYPVSSQLAALRMIRKQNGVGRPPAVMLARLQRLGWAPAWKPGEKHPKWFRGIQARLGPAARKQARWLKKLTTFLQAPAAS